MSELYRYFVEGECEKKLLRAFMYIPGKAFRDGRVEVFNFINEKMSKQGARSIKKGTKIVIVVDTDIKNTEILDYNIELLKNVSLIDEKNITMVFSIKNFEDELYILAIPLKI